jgi:hypothetical protein
MAADTLHVVRTYATTLEAELGKSFLESSGMTALVSADDCGGMRPHLQAKGVALLVHADDLEAAVAALDTASITNPA